MSQKMSSANAHSLLNLMLAKAVLKGEAGRGHIYLPLEDLLAEQDRTEFIDGSPEAAGLLLKLSIQIDWEAADDVDLEAEVNIEMKDVEELENESDTGPSEEAEVTREQRAPANKNKKSH